VTSQTQTDAHTTDLTCSLCMVQQPVTTHESTSEFESWSTLCQNNSWEGNLGCGTSHLLHVTDS